MNDFNRCKVTGVRWLKKPVEDMKIHVRLKPQDSILCLPKFDEYANESNGLSLEKLDKKIEECTLKWQQKVFSLWELQRYSDVHNCLTEDELTYHDMIKNQQHEPSKIFTYIHEDYRLPLPMELKKQNEEEFQIQSLTSCFEALNIGDKMEQFLDRIKAVTAADSSSMGHLFKSTENIVSGVEEWKAMHVVFDNSEYNEDYQLLLKQESILLSIYHNQTYNYVILCPDVNSLELNPYSIEIDNVPLGYQYCVDVVFEDNGDGEELVTLLRKLHRKWERQQKNLLSFEMPALGTKQYFISLEILKATDFEMDNLYVDYNIKLPDGVLCQDVLHGRTHVAKAIRIDDKECCNFGHIIELNLEANTGVEPHPIKLFFEVISTDWWGRHRTEGYCYLALTPTPGYYSKQLSCSRPEEMDSVEAESRRFFVGGCHLIKDLEVLAQPQLLDNNMKFVSTGDLSIRWSVISQSALPGALPSQELYGTSSASSLLLGAEAVLRQYRKARARLAAATEGLSRGETSL